MKMTARKLKASFVMTDCLWDDKLAAAIRTLRDCRVISIENIRRRGKDIIAFAVFGGCKNSRTVVEDVLRMARNSMGVAKTN